MHNVFLDAVDRVLSWDLPEEALAGAVAAQVQLMAGMDIDDPGGLHLD